MTARFRPEDADAWLERNRAKLGQRDPVFDLLASTGMRARAVLEIGCANGWRLSRLRDAMGCRVAGVEPSVTAVQEARRAGLQDVHIGTADSLPFANGAFDLVIFGFCLYLAEPSDYFRIVAEADRVLSDGGDLVIHDFPDTTPFKRRYEHRDGLWSHHLDWARLWTGHPAYHVCRRSQDTDACVTVLRKSEATAFPVRLG